MPKKSLNPKEIEMVYNSIEDFIQENHKLCFIKDIAEITGLPKSKCEKILDFLKKKKESKLSLKLKVNPQFIYQHICLRVFYNYNVNQNG